MAERQPTNQLDDDDVEERQFAKFKKLLKDFRRCRKKNIGWLKKNGFHEVVDTIYMTVEYRNSRSDCDYLVVMPEGRGWRSIACIGGAWEYGTDATAKTPESAIRKSKARMRKMQERQFKRIYKKL